MSFIIAAKVASVKCLSFIGEIGMEESVIKVEWENQPVLTTRQLAEAYRVAPKNIHMNYSNAKEYFREGVHYFKLSGELLRQLKREVKSFGGATIPVNVTQIYLWTCQGAARHCKMLNTPEAWRVFSELENVYFGVKDGEKIAPPVQQILPLPTNDEQLVRKLKEEKETKARLERQLMKITKPEFAVVYAMLVSNGTVKIGYSGNITERVKAIKSEFKLNVLQVYTTNSFSVDDAKTLEEQLKTKYSAYCMGGEFFDICFDDVCKDLKAMII